MKLSTTSQNDSNSMKGQVLQNFLDENGRLPRWNVAFNTLTIKIIISFP
jgi:hypothetical protein